jgi:hypothetical protein
MAVVLHVLVSELISLQQLKGALMDRQHLAHIQVLLTVHLCTVLQHLHQCNDSLLSRVKRLWLQHDSN